MSPLLCAAWFVSVAAQWDHECVVGDSKELRGIWCNQYSLLQVSQPMVSPLILREESDQSSMMQVAKKRLPAEQLGTEEQHSRTGAWQQSPNVLFSIGTGMSLSSSLKACLTTWAADLGPHELQIIGGKPLEGIPQSAFTHWDPAHKCSDDHSGGACKDAVGLVNGYEAGAQWVMLVGPDNYVVPENVAKVLSSYNASEPIVLGIKGCGDCPAGGLCGGGGQIFSRGALHKMIGGNSTAFFQTAEREANACGMWGDVQNCRVAAMNDVPVETLLGLRGWAEEVTQIRDEMKSQSPWPLTWHYVDPNKMQAVHKLKQQHPLEALQISRHGSNDAEHQINYLQAMMKYVKDEDARRKKHV